MKKLLKQAAVAFAGVLATFAECWLAHLLSLKWDAGEFGAWFWIPWSLLFVVTLTFTGALLAALEAR